MNSMKHQWHQSKKRCLRTFANQPEVINAMGCTMSALAERDDGKLGYRRWTYELEVVFARHNRQQCPQRKLFLERLQQ
jgi:hypothetical protein